jgi:hypothetical protein
VRAASPALAAALLCAPVAAAATPAPSPSAADRTTLAMSPAAGPDESSFVASGDSDCHLMAVTMTYVTYGGEQRQVGKQDQNAAALGGGRYHYRTTVQVPVDARPQTARVQAEPLCGSEADGFPPSAPRSFDVTRARPRISLLPQEVRPGETTRIRVRSCFGAAGAITITVRLPGLRTVTVRAAVADSTATGQLSVPADAAPGAASASVGRSTCPGSTSRTASFHVIGGPAASPSDRTGPAGVATPQPTPSATAAASRPTGADQGAASRPARGRSQQSSSWLTRIAVVAALAVTALAATAAMGIRRRRRRL